MMDPIQKLQTRIRVQAKFAVGAGVRLYDMEQKNKPNRIFEKGDTICRNLIKAFIEKQEISTKQVSILKEKLQKYAKLLYDTGGVNPVDMNSGQITPVIPAPAEKIKIKKNLSSRKVLWVTRGKSLEVKFENDPVVISKLKQMNGTKYKSKEKKWTVRRLLENAYILREMGFTFIGEAKKWFDTYNYKDRPKCPKTIKVPGLQLPLRPFQEEGVAFVQNSNGRALIADEMGLGKTAQSLAWMQLSRKMRPCIVLCPATLKYNWAKECQKWLRKPTVYIITGRPVHGVTNPLDNSFLYCKGDPKNIIVIINYDIIANNVERVINKQTQKKEIVEIKDTGWMSPLIKLKGQIIVIDEAHYLKNKKALRTKASLKVANTVPSIVALTGTPIVNRPLEFYNIIQLINPYIFTNFTDFGMEFCDGKHDGYGWNFNGSSNHEKLHAILKEAIMIRRLKKDVLPELPEKVRTVIPLHITNRSQYVKAEKDFIQWLKDNGLDEAATNAERAQALVRIEALKKLAVKGKIKECIAWIRDFIESGEKLVVFASHTHVIDALIKEFKSFKDGGLCVHVTGSVSHADRQKAVDTFQNEPGCTLFFGNIQAAGVGITLTAASNTCFIEFAWDPGAMAQAEDRVHRIGQTSDSVNAWYLIALGTIEESVAEMLDTKTTVIDAVVDGQTPEESALLTNLITRFSK